MESRIKCLFLIGLLPFAAMAQTAADDDSELLDPQIERREVKEFKIDNENVELGLSLGMISIEDFGVNPITVFKAAYHLSEDVFVEANYGVSEGSETSFESLSGGTSLLTDDERKYEFYSLSMGYNLLPGQAFLARRKAITTAWYVTGGLGNTDFAGDGHFTLSVGTGYRMLLNDWLAAHVEFRDQMFELDILGEKKQTHNIQLLLGASAFF